MPTEDANSSGHLVLSHFWTCKCSNVETTSPVLVFFADFWVSNIPRYFCFLLDLHRIMSGFHGAFSTGVTCQQGTLILPYTWFRSLFGTCLCSNSWDQIPQTYHVLTQLSTLNTPWCFFDFALATFSDHTLNFRWAVTWLVLFSVMERL